MIIDNIVKTFIESGAKRMDGDTDQFEYKIYWAGTIIRVDLKLKGGDK